LAVFRPLRLFFYRCLRSILVRAGKPDDRPRSAQICVCEAGARDAGRSIRRKQNPLIDIDRNLYAGLDLARISCARVTIRICTDTKINVVVKPVRLSIAGTHIR
jgi:hypothetical protein